MPDRTIGVLGLGLLGRGIATCLLSHGFRVIACDRNPAAHESAHRHIAEALRELVEHAGFPESMPKTWEANYLPVERIAELAPCDFVIESITEDLAEKRAAYDELEGAIRPDVPIASNTSALPISLLQRGRRHPERFAGMHWGEPAHVLRFLEIIRGDRTSDAAFDATVELAQAIGKEPSLVRKDVRGFVTNRLMYAMLREAFHLLETGVADVETIDRSFRNDIGWWATLAGPFRWMDLTGLPAYAAVMRDLFPELSNAAEVPQSMQRLVDAGALGTSNGKGFYTYTGDEAAAWNRAWADFTWDIRRLADKHLPSKQRETGDAPDH